MSAHLYHFYVFHIFSLILRDSCLYINWIRTTRLCFSPRSRLEFFLPVSCPFRLHVVPANFPTDIVFPCWDVKHDAYHLLRLVTRCKSARSFISIPQVLFMVWSSNTWSSMSQILLWSSGHFLSFPSHSPSFCWHFINLFPVQVRDSVL